MGRPNKKSNNKKKVKGLMNTDVLSQAEMTSKLCNVMLNAQELVDDLEDLQAAGLFKQSLKGAARTLVNQCLTQVDKIFGVGQKKVFEAVKNGASEEEIEKLRALVKSDNKEMLNFYETAMTPRYQFKRLEFNERLLCTRIIKDIKEDNVKYVGSDLYYRIETSEELEALNKGN